MTNEKISKKVIKKAKENGWKQNIDIYITYTEALKLFIFSHDFAKAFWGREDRNNWKWHLQEMVILSDNEKFKYLEKFL